MKTALLAALAVLTLSAHAQTTVSLWDSAPPADNGIAQAENIDANHWITNVSAPSLTVYLPEKRLANGKAVVICPGGGYAGLASHHEGTLFAQWLNARGIAAVILKYRMPNGHRDIPLDDARQAIRYVRTHAAQWNIHTDKIGIAGFSAGGHLAATASTRFTTSGISSRPDFSILFYPVITMDHLTHHGSRDNLLGHNPSHADIHLFSIDRQVNAGTPPAILLLSDDDRVVLPQNSIQYYTALKNNDIEATMHIFPTGGHGWGLRPDFTHHRQMLDLLAAWLEQL
jgi:acetyl esterase/lipase